MIDALTDKEERFCQVLAETGFKESANWYLYLLSNPMTNEVFYVGKGKGNRIDAHEKEAESGKHSKKCNMIRLLLDRYGRIDKVKLAYFWDEQAAYDAETDLISDIGLDNLTNVMPGGQKAWNERVIKRRKSHYKAGRKWAANIISRLKLYDDWISEQSKDSINELTNLFGSPLEFYRKFLDEVMAIYEKRMPSQSVIVCDNGKYILI